MTSRRTAERPFYFGEVVPAQRLESGSGGAGAVERGESSSEYDWYDEGAATLASRLDYVKERLRLFYVGITRAKRELIVTWNTGRQGDATPSLALSALMGWWEAVGMNM